MWSWLLYLLFKGLKLVNWALGVFLGPNEREEGRNAQLLVDQEAENEKLRKIVKSSANAPKTREELEVLLRDGKL